MTNNKSITVEIDENGNCTIDGQGFVGTECAYFLKEIEESLGETTSSHNKPEYQKRSSIRNRRMERN